MGLLDTCSPKICNALVTAVLLGMGAIFVGMCTTAPAEPLIGANEDLSAINSGDTAWMLTSTAIVLLMTPGVCFFYCGMGDHKNLVSTIMQALMPMAIVPIMWTIIGFSLAFGPSVNSGGGIFGNPAAYGMGYNVGAAPNALLVPTIPTTLYWMFQCVFAIITPALIIGSVADRVNCSALCIFVALWHVFVYCPLAHMVWYPTGLIRQFGVVDFAGGTVVHMASGWAALVAAIYLGRNHLNREHEIFGGAREPANVPYVVLGTALLWMGWFGFNAGSAGAAGVLSSQVMLCSNAAAASAMATWVLLDIVKGHKMSCMGACVGAVVGLVVITPAAGFVNIGGAYLLGMIGAAVCSGAQWLMEKYGKQYITDTAEVFVCHGVGGTTGMILTSLFSTLTANSAGVDGAFYGNGLQLGKTLAVCCCLIPWICIFTWGCLWVTDMILTLRCSDEDMLVGLDVSKHGERAFYVKGVTDLEAHPGSVHGINGTKGAPVVTTTQV